MQTMSGLDTTDWEYRKAMSIKMCIIIANVAIFLLFCFFFLPFSVFLCDCVCFVHFSCFSCTFYVFIMFVSNMSFFLSILLFDILFCMQFFCSLLEQELYIRIVCSLWRKWTKVIFLWFFHDIESEVIGYFNDGHK